MSILEQARKAYAQLKLKRNDHAEPPTAAVGTGERSELSEERPPASPRLSRGGAPVFDCPEYRLVRFPAELLLVTAAIDSASLIGLDLETTGLDPRADRVRLMCLSLHAITYVVDCFALDPSPLWGALSGRELAIHNAAFDLAFLSRLGFTPGVAHDTLLMAKLLAAGTPDFNRCSLKECARREFNLDLDKRHQRDDWSGALTADMLTYAAADALTHRRLYEELLPRVREAGLLNVLKVEERALPAFVWLRLAGVFFDRPSWQALDDGARHEADDLTRRLDAVAPERSGFPDKERAWSWASPRQVREALKLLGHDLDSTGDETLARIDHPLAALLREYRAATKRASTYGTDWIQHVAADGRIYASWNQLGSVAGRTSCSGPNLQQVPRDRRYRRCFAAPDGRVLVKADYSQLQLRIAAKVANEERMLAAYRAGDDLHTLTARRLTGKEDVTKDDRQLAKAVNFGLLFGLGARGLRGYAKSNYGLDLTEAQAAQYRQAFFAAYPGLQRWHRRAGNSSAPECRTLGGRRRLLNDKTPYTQRLNTPVQGTEADGAKLALALLWERRAECPGAFPCCSAMTRSWWSATPARPTPRRCGSARPCSTAWRR
jgi:DNA polymerase-1